MSSPPNSVCSAGNKRDLGISLSRKLPVPPVDSGGQLGEGPRDAAMGGAKGETMSRRDDGGEVKKHPQAGTAQRPG